MRPVLLRPIKCAALCALFIATSAFAEPLTITVINERTDEPVENAVVTLPGAGKPSTDTFTIAQENRAFRPGLLVIPAGSEVNFPNRDNTQHHVYSFSEAKTFNIELYAGEPEAPIQFDQSGIVEIGCNIHDHMQGFILVTDRPHYALTDTNGQARFDVASSAGKQPVKANIWHRRFADTDRYSQHTLTPDSLSEMRVRVTLEPRNDGNDELDQIQQEFQDL
ncbi:methylamine utilization protein [Halospina sp. K52047b]|uniref:methylamine utilization protein n=1 Tax=Halospina sp. K52047b TaxID=2614160 RepID=UPI00124A997B|nr:methylamine utilization protein [Halospina sp. K52047b]KAA8983511.1 methylamine utilization protein [Halospina sp. K52047b]